MVPGELGGMHRPSQPQACSPLPRWRLQNSQEQVSGLRGSASLTSVPGTALGRGSGSMPLPRTPRPGPYLTHSPSASSLPPDPESQRKRTVQNVLDLRQNLEETMSSLRGSQVTHR